MSLLLAALSVLTFWSFLALLALGLLLIRKTLESVRMSLERITMGVRAIEKETTPLGPHAIGFTNHLGEALDAVAALPDVLVSLDRELGRIREKGVRPLFGR
jgi:hypothetical protein